MYPRLKDVSGITLYRSYSGGYNRWVNKIKLDWYKQSLCEKNSGCGIIYITTMQKDLKLHKATDVEVRLRFY